MALPIAPTPFLPGRDAERFDRIVADGLSHRIALTLPDVNGDEIHRIQSEIAVADRKGSTRRAV